MLETVGATRSEDKSGLEERGLKKKENKLLKLTKRFRYFNLTDSFYLKKANKIH